MRDDRRKRGLFHIQLVAFSTFTRFLSRKKTFNKVYFYCGLQSLVNAEEIAEEDAEL